MSPRPLQDLFHFELGQEGRRDLQLLGLLIQEDALLRCAQWRDFQLECGHGTPLEGALLIATPDVTAREQNGQFMGRGQGIVVATKRPQLPHQFGRQGVGTLDHEQQGGRLALQHAEEAVGQRILRIEQGARHHLLKQQLAHVCHLHGRTADEAHHPHLVRQLGQQGFTQGATAAAGLAGEKNKGVIELNQMQQPVNQLPLGRQFKQFVIGHDQTRSPPSTAYPSHRPLPEPARSRLVTPAAACLPAPSCHGAYGE